MMLMISPERFACRPTSAPHPGCFLTTSKSAADSFPGQLRIASGTPILPQSWSQLPCLIARRVTSERPRASAIFRANAAPRSQCPRVYGSFSSIVWAIERRVASSPSRRERTTLYRCTPPSMVRTISSSTHGFTWKRNTSPWLIASIAVGRSAYPVRRTLTVSGEKPRTRESSSTPRIPGMRLSDTTTATGSVRRISSASSPFPARRTRRSLSSNSRSSAFRMFASSSTIRTVSITDRLLLHDEDHAVGSVRVALEDRMVPPVDGGGAPVPRRPAHLDDLVHQPVLGLRQDVVAIRPDHRSDAVAEGDHPLPVALEDGPLRVQPHHGHRKVVEDSCGLRQQPVLRGQGFRPVRHAPLEVPVERRQIVVLPPELLREFVVLPPEVVPLEGVGDGDPELVVVPRLGDEPVDLPLVDGGDDRAGVRVSRQDDADRLGPPFPHLAEKLHAVHPRHPVVGDDDGDGSALIQDQKPLRPGGGRQDLVGVVEKKARERPEDRLLVVDAKDAGRFSHRQTSSTTGIRTVNTAPFPGSLRTVISPLCFFTMSEVMLRPSPVPLPTSFVVKKGSKIRFRFASGIPWPVSATETQTYPSSSQDRTVMTPCCSMACAALTSRFMKTWFNCWG